MATIVGIGLDLIDLENFRIHYGTFDPELLERCFTNKEIADIGQGVDRLERLAGRFAVKEATFKAFGGSAGIRHLDIETISSSSGAPEVHLSAAARNRADELGATNIFVSISHCAASAGAVVVVCSNPR